MRVFVAGATGVIGRRAVARLVAAGHQVTGVARAPEKAQLLASLGAASVEVSIFDRDALRVAIAGHDAVVNLATKIPPLRDMARSGAWAENERIRTEATGCLVDAAIAAGASVFVQESLAFMYGEHGADWLDAASTSLSHKAVFTNAVETAEANVARFEAQGGRGVVLRFGKFYAPDSDQAAATLNMARRGLRLDVGATDGYAPLIDADDAAAAVVCALDAPAGTYDIVDEPTTRAEQSRALATAVGRRRLWAAPSWMKTKSAAPLAWSQRVSNRRFCDATGWSPASASAREGYPKLARALGVEPALPGRVRLMLWILVVSAFGVGVQAAFFPRSFYDDFPYGRGWVAMDGFYNEHLIRDVGVLNLALLVVTVGALFMASTAMARITAVAWLVYSVPHLVYHLRHLGMSMEGADKVGIAVSLSIPVLAAIVILVTRRRAPTIDLTRGTVGG